MHRAGRAAPAEPKFVAVTRSRLKQRSDAPHPLLLPDPGKAGPPRGHSPLPAGICPGGVTSLQPAPSATPAKPRRPDPGEAAGESPAESSPAAPGLPLPAQPGGCRSQAAGSRFPPGTAPRRGALEPLPHTRGSCDPEQEAGGEGKEEKQRQRRGPRSGPGSGPRALEGAAGPPPLPGSGSLCPRWWRRCFSGGPGSAPAVGLAGVPECGDAPWGWLGSWGVGLCLPPGLWGLL